MLTTDKRVDVLVVGGGYTGLSTALHLAKQGVDVLLLEAFEIGYGASGRNVGLTNAGLWIMPAQTKRELGNERGDILNQFLIDAPKYVSQLITENKLNCDFKNNGTLHLAHNEKSIEYLQNRQSQLEKYGADINYLDSDEVYGLTKAENYYGALKDSNAGTLHPLKYCQGLAKIALKHGAKIYSNSAIISIEKCGAGLKVESKNATIIANKVILATNAYEQKILQNSCYYTPLYYCQLASEPLSDAQHKHCLPKDNGCWDSRMVMRSFRKDIDRRLIVGTVGNIHHKDAKYFKHWTKHIVAKSFPHIGDLKYQFAWSGRIAKSKNNIPQILEIDNNIYQILGYSGRGIAAATVTGRAMATLLTGGMRNDEMPIPLNEAKKVSFSRLQGAIYELGSQLSHISDHLIR